MNQNNSFAQAPNPHNFINLSSLQNQAIPLLTAPSTDNQFLTYLLMQNNQNNQNFNNMQGVFHDLSKNMNMQDPMFNIQLQMNSNSFRNSNNGINQNQIPYESNNNQAASQNVMLSKDFLNKIYNIITMQHKLITEIKDKNSLLFEGFGKLTSEFNEFK